MLIVAWGNKKVLIYYSYPLLLEHTLPSDPAGEGVGLTLFPFPAWALALGETPCCWWLEGPGLDEAC